MTHSVGSAHSNADCEQQGPTYSPNLVDKAALTAVENHLSLATPETEADKDIQALLGSPAEVYEAQFGGELGSKTVLPAFTCICCGASPARLEKKPGFYSHLCDFLIMIT